MTKSSARKGNLPVRVQVDQGVMGRTADFTQELVAATAGFQTVRLGYVRASFLLWIQWLNVLAGLGLVLVALGSTTELRRLAYAVGGLAVLGAFAGLLMHWIPGADVLDYLVVAMPIACMFHCLRWFEGLASATVTRWRRVEPVSPAAESRA